MASTLITKRLVDAAEAGDQDKFLWDRDITGFGLKVSPTGRKVYVLQFRMGGRGSPTKRYTIGKHGAPWTPDGARKEAILLLEQVRRGIDPILAARERTRNNSAHPFDRYLDHFLELYGKRFWASRTYKSADSNLRRFVLPQLKARPLASIRRGDVMTIMDGLPRQSPALARSVFAQARKLFSWAVERGDLDVTPFAGLRAPPSVSSRSRVLSDGELKKILSASQKIGEVYGAFVRLLILTGQRRNEVAGMEWGELSLSSRVWTIPGSKTKNGEAQLLPLTSAIWHEIKPLYRSPARGGRYVFATSGESHITAFSSAKKRLDCEIDRLCPGDAPPGWRFHDLRRTFATGLQRLGARFEVTEGLLNHVSGKAGVVGVYQRHDWSSEKRRALAQWSSRMVGLMGTKSGGAAQND